MGSSETRDKKTLTKRKQDEAEEKEEEEFDFKIGEDRLFSSGKGLLMMCHGSGHSFKSDTSRSFSLRFFLSAT
jgi:hypothetical protein